MREILFRGKRTDNGEWVEGDLLHNLIYDGRENEKRIGNIYFEHNNEIHGTEVYNVIPETVGQYTGLTDTNGKKIFEGDIVKEWVRNAFSTKVTFAIHEVAFSLGFCGFEPFANYDSDCGIYTDADDCEVIGNIHDNPELLTGEGQK